MRHQRSPGRARSLPMASLLAAITMLATWGIPFAAGAQGSQAVTTPTGTLAMGSTIPIQWNPAFSSATTVEVSLAGYGGTPLVLATQVGNDGSADVVLPLPPALPCEPQRLYWIIVRPTGAANGVGDWSASFKLDCDISSILVVKTVVNHSGHVLAGQSYTVDVDCGVEGPHATLSLSAANGFQGTVGRIAPGRRCAVRENAPEAPAGCRWSTSYPQGRVIDVGPREHRVEIVNRLDCAADPGGCPQGQSLTRFPGSDATYCCGAKPGGDKLCCTRAGTGDKRADR